MVSNLEELKTCRLGSLAYLKPDVKIGNEALIIAGSLCGKNQFSVLINGHSIEEMEYIQHVFTHLLLLSHQAKCEIKYFEISSVKKSEISGTRCSGCNCEELTSNFTGRYMNSLEMETVCPAPADLALSLEFEKTIVFHSCFLELKNFLNFAKSSKKCGTFLNFLEFSKIIETSLDILKILEHFKNIEKYLKIPENFRKF